MDYTIQSLQNKSSTLVISAPSVEGYVLGRSDEATEYNPDINLNTFDARDKGVSRRHCALVLFQGELHVVDLSSVNGTFVNGKRLSPETPYPLTIGDELRLGTLDLILLKQKD